MPAEPIKAETEYGAGGRLAVAIFRVLRDRSDADRELVLRALEPASGQAGSEAEAICRAALRACSEELGRSPSRRAYDAWRDGLSVRAEQPSSSLIRTTFGSWPKALNAIDASPAANVLTRRLTSRGGQFSGQELIAGLRACAAALGKHDFTQAELLQWAREQRRLDPRVRIPTSANTFIRVFGSWREAKEAAGLQQEEQRLVPDIDFPQAVQVVANCLGERPTRNSYDRCVREQNRRDSVYLPVSATIVAHYGAWADALFAAGLISENQAVERRRRRVGYLADDDVLQFVVTAISECGTPLTPTQYERWRRSQPGAAGSIPASKTIKMRFGSFDTATSRARAVLEGGSGG